MGNKRQTAVEWQHEKVSNVIEQLKGKYVNQEEFLDSLLRIRNQAKELEKEHIVEAWCNGFDEEDRATSNPLKYYDKTFNTDNP